MVQQIRKIFTIQRLLYGNGMRGRGGASDRWRGLGLVTGLAATQANLFLFSQGGRRQRGEKEREKEGGISRSNSPYPHAIFFWQILHYEE